MILAKAGDIVPIRVSLYDLGFPTTIPLWIERLSDGYFWDGTAFVSTVQSLTMKNMHLDTGDPTLPSTHTYQEYQYRWTVPSDGTGDQYEWSSLFDIIEDTGYEAHARFRGLISTTVPQWIQQMTQLGLIPAATATPQDIVRLVGMVLRNKLTTTATLYKILGDLGGDEFQSTLSDVAGTFTRAELVDS